MHNLSSLWTYFLRNLLPMVGVLLGGVVVIRSLLRWLHRTLLRSRLDRAAHGLVRRGTAAVLYLLLGLLVASGLGIDITGLVTLAGVLTLAVSLALQSALTNLVSGIALLYTHPFVAGDFVQISGESGVVEEVGLAYTRLVTADNKRIALPNGTVSTAQIVNYTAAGTRRVDITVYISCAEDVDTVLQILRRAAAIEAGEMLQSPVAAVYSYSEWGVCYVLQVWCTAAEYYSTLFRVNRNIKKLLDEAHISMACPQMQVHLQKTDV